MIFKDEVLGVIRCGSGVLYNFEVWEGEWLFFLDV